MASGVKRKRSLPATSSSSRCMTQGITAVHDFEVTNYSLLEGMGVGEFIESMTFSVGGCDWSIRFYPDGDDDDSDSESEQEGDDAEQEAGAFASAFLCFKGGPANPRVQFKFRLFDKGFQVSTKRGKRRKKVKEVDLLNTAATTYTNAGETWGVDKFFEKSVLRDFLQASNGCFTIRCHMSVIRTHVEDQSTIQIPESVMHQDLARMLRESLGTDVTFSVGDRFFHAHRYILAARSMVFKAQLFGDMKEEDAQCIKVDDMVPAAFEGLLHYIYTDTLSEDYTVDRIMVTQHLLVAADRYGLDRLKVMCEARLRGWIDVQSVATTLALAEQHRCEELKIDCLRFLAWPDVLRVAMKTEEFGHLLACYPSVTSDILEMAVSTRIDDE